MGIVLLTGLIAVALIGMGALNNLLSLMVKHLPPEKQMSGAVGSTLWRIGVVLLVLDVVAGMVWAAISAFNNGQ